VKLSGSSFGRAISQSQLNSGDAGNAEIQTRVRGGTWRLL
jgi:hypothetical protein